MRRGSRFLATLLVVALAATGCTGDDGAAPSAGAGGLPAGGGGAYPRNETLYTSGTQWGPPNSWNPIIPGHATGTVGLAYETLFLFDPEKLELTPWLAEKGEWTDEDLHGDPPRRDHLGRRQAADRRRRRVHRRARQVQGGSVQQPVDLARARSTPSTRAR